MRTALRRCRRALLVLLTFAVAVAAFASAADAGTVKHQPRQKLVKVTKKKVTKKRVPGCPSLGRVRAGAHAWMDAAQGMRSPLYVNTDKLICSAADRSRIEIKSWFISGTDPSTVRLASHLALMHRYHHVSVVILVGRNGYTKTGSRRWGPFVDRFKGFASIKSCPRRCATPTDAGLTHAKFITVSRLRSGGTGVMSTSSNFTDQQYNTFEHGIFVAGDTGLYNAFHARFTGWINHRIPVRADSWVSYRYVAAYFSPVAIAADPDHAELSRVDCRHGGLIEATSLRINSHAVAADLVRLRRQGCTVRVIIEHRSNVQRQPLPIRCALTHDKAIVVNTPGRKEVIAGSEDFGWGGLHSNDQQMLRWRSAHAVSAFHTQFVKTWANPSSCLAP